MKRNVVSRAQAAVRGVRHQPVMTASSPPFICTSCRRAALHQTSTPPRPSKQRTFSTSRIPRQQSSPREAQQPQRESVLPQTHYDFFPETFPNGPPPKSPFRPDLRQLRKEYLQLQAKSHPDLAPAAQKRQAEALSMRVNEAYKAIQDPLKRAQYLLSLHGIDVEDESAKLEESALLMEVMEAREAVDEVEKEDELVALREENNARMEESMAVLDGAFAEGDLERAAKEAVRLRYWANIEESIHGWEKGKGGGVIHH